MPQAFLGDVLRWSAPVYAPVRLATRAGFANREARRIRRESRDVCRVNNNSANLKRVFLFTFCQADRSLAPWSHSPHRQRKRRVSWKQASGPTLCCCQTPKKKRTLAEQCPLSVPSRYSLKPDVMPSSFSTDSTYGASNAAFLLHRQLARQK